MTVVHPLVGDVVGNVDVSKAATKTKTSTKRNAVCGTWHSNASLVWPVCVAPRAVSERRCRRMCACPRSVQSSVGIRLLGAAGRLREVVSHCPMLLSNNSGPVDISAFSAGTDDLGTCTKSIQSSRTSRTKSNRTPAKFGTRCRNSVL